MDFENYEDPDFKLLQDLAWTITNIIAYLFISYYYYYIFTS